MTRTKKLLLTLSAAVAVAALAGVAVLAVMAMRTPTTVSLTDAVASTQASASLPTSASSSPAAGGLTGTWKVVTGSSFVGYRVKEELARVGATTAVGRTTAVTGTLTYDGSKITTVEVQADLSQLASDSSMRDSALRQQALQTSTYPTATFALTQPIAIAATPAPGAAIDATAVGNLTLHGQTRPVSIPLQGTLVDGNVVIVCSTTVVFADYGIRQPTAQSVLSIDDRGILELQLVFARA